ncbi:MAG TPA: hypothetical protein VM580_04670 [Labilithrix sp.]|nr:hypothetical protein [Labilithrix sp.]
MAIVPPLPRPWASSSTITMLTVLAIVLAFGIHRGDQASGRSFADVRTAAALEWRAAHPDASNLHVVSTEVTFVGSPENFALGEGIVVAPLATAFEGVQDVIDIRATPAPSRVMRVDGNVVVAWAYAGKIHRDLRYSAHALVRRPIPTKFMMPEAPSFASLEREALLDATATAREVGGHGLARCAELDRWAKETAGSAPHTEQVLRIVRRVASGIRATDEKRSRTHDTCASIRDGVYSAHRAHVVAVMAARQNGIPAYGFLSASGRYYVATFVDTVGWVMVDLTAPEPGFDRGPPGLLTRTPVSAAFEASTDEFWLPNARAYREEMGSVRSFSWTEWLFPETAVASKDATITSTIPLTEALR